MHKVIYNSSDLPAEWESLIGDNLYLTIPFLKELEDIQKRKTEYHLFYDSDNTLDSLFVLFIYPDFPFFKNTILPYSKKISMIYFPLPFSRSSIIVGSRTQKEVESVIKRIRGFTILANIAGDQLLDLPYELSYARCTIQVKWDSFEGYLGSLRSHYRYKYRKILKRADELIIKEVEAENFNNEMYRLYENVYEKTDLKINKAEPGFFKSRYSRIISINTGDKCIGFVQLIENSQELVFSLVGLDYSYNRKYNLYVRLLLEVIRYGIEKGFKVIDLGQTTYDAKRKLGSEIEKLYIQVNHHNKLLFRLILLFRHILVDKQDYSTNYHVFKNETEES